MSNLTKIEIKWVYEAQQWFAWLPDEYDGAEDAGFQPVGWGDSQADALSALAASLEYANR